MLTRASHVRLGEDCAQAVGDSRSPGQAANWLRDKEPLVHMDPTLQAVRAENLV
jgi:hypothetical protein